MDRDYKAEEGLYSWSLLIYVFTLHVNISSSIHSYQVVYLREFLFDKNRGETILIQSKNFYQNRPQIFLDGHLAQSI